MIADPKELGEFVVACVDMLGRTGAREVQIRYDEEQEPVVWVAVVAHSIAIPGSTITSRHWSVGAGMSPDAACYKLVETVLDGGQCTHCGGVVGVERDWTSDLSNFLFPDGRMSCWTCFDPELKTFRRSCEGDTTQRTEKQE